MSKIIDESLQKMAKGSAAVLIGTIISMVLGFLSRIILVRFTTQNEYGIYSLALTIVTICTTVSALGLQEGTTRYIAYFRGKNETKNIQDIIFSSIIISILSSISVTILVFTIADYIATEIYNSPEITYILKIMLISIPFTVLINVIISIFRGFDKVTTRVYFSNVLHPMLYIFLLGVTVYLKFSFVEMILVYSISSFTTFLLLPIYFFKKIPISLNWREIQINHNTRVLLINSIPLLGISILLMIMSWTDTLMIGYFKTVEMVASYSAVYPLAALLSTGITSMGFLYVPIVSQLYGKNQITELRKINENSTKWNFIITLPIFFLMFIFPDFVLNIFYGFRYIEASKVLQILSLGFIMNSLFGFNYYTLLSAGKSRLLINCSLISAIMNIFLNLILIPKYGMIGAAVASAASFTFIEMYMTFKLHRFLKIHPFTKIYTRFIITSCLLISVFYAFRTQFAQTIWTIGEFYLIFLATYVISILLTKSIESEDLKILIQIEKRIGTNFLTTAYKKLVKI